MGIFTDETKWIERKSAMAMQEIQGKLMTVDSLAEDMRRLGVSSGMTVIVHASFKSLGSWVLGGPVSVILALEKVLGPEGTLVMPAHSNELCDPSTWQNPPVNPAWWDEIRRQMPPYDPDLTPTRMMGAIAESFRKQSGTIRSRHPMLSFAARGKHAERITQNHSYAHGLGNESPLGRIYELGGYVLLLGVTNANNTSLHLAECRADYGTKQNVTVKSPVLQDGKPCWVAYDEVDYDSSDFHLLGECFERETGKVRRGKIGEAESLLIPQRDIVDYAADWMKRTREIS